MGFGTNWQKNIANVQVTHHTKLVAVGAIGTGISLRFHRKIDDKQIIHTVEDREELKLLIDGLIEIDPLKSDRLQEALRLVGGSK